MYIKVIRFFSLTRRSRCSRILRASDKNASSMFMFDLHETSKNGISKFSAICKAIKWFLIDYHYKKLLNNQVLANYT